MPNVDPYGPKYIPEPGEEHLYNHAHDAGGRFASGHGAAAGDTPRTPRATIDGKDYNVIDKGMSGSTRTIHASEVGSSQTHIFTHHNGILRHTMTTEGRNVTFINNTTHKTPFKSTGHDNYFGSRIHSETAKKILDAANSNGYD